jgi:hypothetical protein
MKDRLKLVAATATAALIAFGPVAIARADTSVTASNSSGSFDGSSGDARATNSGASEVGQNSGHNTNVNSSDVVNKGSGDNVQEGDNTFNSNQSVTVKSGDVVGGQVIGAVSAGNLTINATNSSTNEDLSSGDARGSNDVSSFTGLLSASSTNIGSAADVLNRASATNVQEGDNRATANQSQNVASGDVVGGQVVGAVTSSGGSADVTLANTSANSDVGSGDSRGQGNSDLGVGVFASPNLTV